MTKESLIKANKRRLVCYPSEKNVAIFVAICHKQNKRRATLMNEFFKSMIDKLSEKQKNDYLELYRTLSPDQIKNVGYNSDEEVD